jgi:hypothetical protein
MNRLWVHVATGLATIVGVSVIVSACAHDDSSLFLQDVLAPPSGGSASGCVFTTDPTQALLSVGYLDVEAISAFSDSYEAVFLAGNQIIPQGNQSQLQTETSRIVLQGAVVTVTDAAGAQLAYYTTLGAGFLDPSNGTTPGYGAVEFTIVDPKTIDSLRASLGWLERETIVTYTKAYGTTLGGDHVESNTFIFPITVCRGCLIAFDTDSSKPEQPNCEQAMSATTTGPTVCFYGQDEPIDCHTCLQDAYCRCGPAAATDPTCFTSVISVTDGGTGGG